MTNQLAKCLHAICLCAKIHTIKRSGTDSSVNDQTGKSDKARPLSVFFYIGETSMYDIHANENSGYGAQGSYTDDKGNSLSSATIIDLYEMVENDNVYACFELWKRFHNDAGQGETVLQALTRAAEIILQDPSAYPSDIASVIFREAGKLVLSDDQEKGFELPGTHQAPPLLCSLTGSRSRKRLAHRLHFA